jgi:hypothetical protein
MFVVTSYLNIEHILVLTETQYFFFSHDVGVFVDCEVLMGLMKHPLCLIKRTTQQTKSKSSSVKRTY